MKGGERNAGMAKIILIAEVLNVSRDYLTGNFCFKEWECTDGKILEELKDVTNKQKEIMMDIIKIIKKYK